MKKTIKFSTLFLIIVSLNSFGQTTKKINSGPLNANNNEKKIVAVDQYGKQYTGDDLFKPLNTQKRAAGDFEVIAGLFRLNFQDQTILSNFFDPILGVQRRACLIQVCNDLSVMLGGSIRNNPIYQPDVYPKDGIVDNKYIELKITGASLGTSVLGNSLVLFGSKNDAITPTLVEDYLITGIDPLYDGTAGAHYHGIFTFNFDFNWNISLTSKPDGSQCDLYTVALHEIVHSLGFSSNIYPGTNTFSIYDSYLEDELGNKLVKIIPGTNIPTSTSSSSDIIKLNPDVDFNQFFGSPATKQMYFHLGSTLIPVFADESYTPGSSFSHFGNTADNDYVMSASLSRGAVNRYLLLNEYNTLKTLGLPITSVFGNKGATLYFPNDPTFTGAVPTDNGTTITYPKDNTDPNFMPTIAYAYGINQYQDRVSQTYFTVNAGSKIDIDLLKDDVNALTARDFKEYDNYFGLYGFAYLSDPTQLSYFKLSDDKRTLSYTPDPLESTHTRVFTYYPYSKDNKKSYIRAYIFINVVGQPIHNTGSCNVVVNGNLLNTYVPPITKYGVQKAVNIEVVGWKMLNGNADFVTPQMNGIGFLPRIQTVIAPARLVNSISDNYVTNDLYVFKADLGNIELTTNTGVFNFYLNKTMPLPTATTFDFKVTQKVFNTIATAVDFEYDHSYKDYIVLNDPNYKYLIFEYLNNDNNGNTGGAFKDVEIEPTDKFTVVPSQNLSTINLNETVTTQLQVQLDNRCIQQKYGFSISLKLPSGVTIQSSNGYFDANGTLIKSITGLTKTNNTINIPVVFVGTSTGDKAIEVDYTYYSCTSSVTESKILSFFVNPTPLTWENLMSNGGTGTTPLGQPYSVNVVGPQNTLAIKNEIINNPMLYVNMSYQDQTMAAAAKLYGDGCDFTISAQNAWYALGNAKQYVTQPAYTLVSPSNDVQTTDYTMWQATSDLIASNVIYPNSKVDLKAGNTITLKSGFNSQSNTVTHAFIVQCNSYPIKSELVENNNKTISNDDISIQPEILTSDAITCELFPNPTHGMFTVRTNDVIESIKVVSLAGVDIKSISVGQSETSFDLSNYTNGLYAVKVILKSKTLEYMVIKQ